jgi:hypothetical protein
VEVALFIWLCNMVACALIAGSKHRSRLGWLVLGFLFGIFALLVLACLPDGLVRRS